MDKIKKSTKITHEESFYIPFDTAASINDSEGVQSGESCRVISLNETFAWMRGFVYAWYGWSNDGKGTFFDFLAVVKAKYDGWKFCCFKPEDMDTVMQKGKPKIKANRIYKNLAWSLTGKTWNKNFAERKGIVKMTLDEEMEAIRFIKQHFFIIYPHDRKYNSMLDNCLYMFEQFGIDAFLWDPFNEVELPDNERGDERLVKVFREVKRFSMETNTSFNIVNHPRSQNDEKVKDGPNKGRFKVVTQFMQLGGSAWDMKMDGQFSIHRPYRHDNPRDPRVHFYNLKQKQVEVVGVERGVYEDIVFDPLTKQYYFGGKNPLTGEEIKNRPTQPDIGAYAGRKKKEQDTPPPINFSEPETVDLTTDPEAPPF